MTQGAGDGGPAFPANALYPSVQGMSLRDWFAGMALQGLLANPAAKDAADREADQDEPKALCLLCFRAFFIADSMLKERPKDFK